MSRTLEERSRGKKVEETSKTSGKLCSLMEEQKVAKEQLKPVEDLLPL